MSEQPTERDSWSERDNRAEVLSRDETAALIARDTARLEPQAIALGIVPGLARVAAVSGWRALSWSVGLYAAGAKVVVERTMSGDPPAEIVANLATDLRSVAWRALGFDEDVDQRGVPESVGPVASTSDDLQARGTELLRRSNDVHINEDSHPAYARILAEITPDEARILRYLFQNGPQPSIDVRTNRPLGIGSELVAGGLNMIAEHAGCRNVDRIHPYLTNLFRLGMIEFSKEQVSNPQRYQLIEAQPKVTDAMKRAGRWPRTVRRSVALTSFGEEFCDACLPQNGPMPNVGRATEVAAAPKRGRHAADPH